MAELHPAGEPGIERFVELTESTPALREYGKRMWMRHETAVARAIAEDVGAPVDDLACAALARFVLESRDLIAHHADPRQAGDEILTLLEHGWEARRKP